MGTSRPTRTVRAHGMQWRCTAQFAPTVPLLDVHRLRRPDDLPPSELVKDSTTRTVARVADPSRPAGPGLYVKRYKFRDLRDRVRYRFVPSKPRKEWRICRALQQEGIPTCDVLAIAVRYEWALPCEGFLLSRELTDTVTLKQFLWADLPGREAAQPGLRRELTAELAALTARLVDARFYHHDYHAGNLLVRPDAPAGERLFVTDLHAIRRRRARRRRLRRMLAMLSGSTDAPSVSPLDRSRFLREFLRRWEGGPGYSREAARRWAAWIGQTVCRLHRRRMRSRTRRCLVESSLFTSEKTDEFKVHRRRDFPLEAALLAVRAHTQAVEGSTRAGRVFRKGRRTEVTVCPCETVPPRTLNNPAPPEDVGPGRVCVKSFRRQSLRERLKDCLRPRSRALSAWIAARGFHVRGIPAAQPLAVLESRHKLSGEPDFLVCEALENEGTLDEFVAEHALTESERRSLGQAVARLLVGMARERVYHPDTKPTNILVGRAEGTCRLWLVDLDRARFSTRMSRRRWVKCLARVNAGLRTGVTLLDRMRCLRECSRGRWGAEERLQVARDVLELSLERLGGRWPEGWGEPSKPA